MIDEERVIAAAALDLKAIHTLPVKMFGPFWSVWCKMALVERGVSLP